jgi:REP element-mobilizing transposase RayT
MRRRNATSIHVLELAFPSGRGGRRDCAGRPRRSAETVPHAKRPPLAARHPVHVTLRVVRGLPRLRRGPTYRTLLAAFGGGSERFGFRLNHFSVQNDHLHLIVEAGCRRSLSRGLQGLTVRIARSLNRAWNRRGRVFAERYHEHVLTTPCEVRNALAYVLNNARKHGTWFRRNAIDPFASGAWFEGWRGGSSPSVVGHGRPPPVAVARTWLLCTGWKRRGLIGVAEMPGG